MLDNSCFLIARNYLGHGCLAYPTHHGTELVELKRYISDLSTSDHLELLTISRPVAYGEYAPYTIVEDKDEFIRLALQI